MRDGTRDRPVANIKILMLLLMLSGKFQKKKHRMMRDQTVFPKDTNPSKVTVER